MNKKISRRRLGVAAILLAVILFAVAAILVINNSSSNTSGSSSNSSSQESSSAEESTAQVATINITKAGFVPAELTINPGTVVVWVNKDTAIHQVESNSLPEGSSKAEYKSEILNKDQQYSREFDEADSYNFQDSQNRASNGVVVVTKAADTESNSNTAGSANQASSSSNSSAYSIIFMVLTLIAVVLLIAFLIRRKRSPKSPQTFDSKGVSSHAAIPINPTHTDQSLPGASFSPSPETPEKKDKE